MSDTPAYLPESRNYFRKFKPSHLEEYKNIEREFGNPERSGYAHYKNDQSVAHYLISIVNNLDETFENVQISEDFPSPEAFIDNSCRSGFTFYVLPLTNKPNAILNEHKAEALDVLKYLDEHRLTNGYDNDDLIIAFRLIKL